MDLSNAAHRWLNALQQDVRISQIGLLFKNKGKAGFALTASRKVVNLRGWPVTRK